MAPLPSSDLSEQKRALRREMSASARRSARERAAARAARRPARGCWRCPSWPRFAGAGPNAGRLRRGPRARSIPRPRWRRRRPAARRWRCRAWRPTAPRLRFHRADAGPLVPGRFGLLEPAATAPEIPLDELDVVIVPGLAFDARGAAAGLRRRLLRRRVRTRARGRRAGADRPLLRLPGRRALPGRRRATSPSIWW